MEQLSKYQIDTIQLEFDVLVRELNAKEDKRIKDGIAKKYAKKLTALNKLAKTLEEGKMSIIREVAKDTGLTQSKLQLMTIIITKNYRH